MATNRELVYNIIKNEYSGGPVTPGRIFLTSKICYAEVKNALSELCSIGALELEQISENVSAYTVKKQYEEEKKKS